jgi:hypothetical protein
MVLKTLAHPISALVLNDTGTAFQGKPMARAARGRPRIERAPDERVPTSVRLRGELFNKLDKAARQHDRPLGNEIEFQLESALWWDQMFPPDLRYIAFDFAAEYRLNGRPGVLRMLLEMGDPPPTEEERYYRKVEIENAWKSHLVRHPIPWSPDAAEGSAESPNPSDDEKRSGSAGQDEAAD